jgi:hypothetical protein
MLVVQRRKYRELAKRAIRLAQVGPPLAATESGTDRRCQSTPSSTRLTVACAHECVTAVRTVLRHERLHDARTCRAMRAA